MANLTKAVSRHVDPWRDLFDLQSFFDRGWPSWPSRSSWPAINVAEDEKNYMIEVAAPGFNKEDFKVNIEDDILTISAEVKREMEETGQNRQYNRREYSYSSFTRSFSLPEDVKEDSITANYVNGILTLTMPKTKPQTKQGKEIRIN